jgi:hypothetical protein
MLPAGFEPAIPVTELPQTARPLWSAYHYNYFSKIQRNELDVDQICFILVYTTMMC